MDGLNEKDRLARDTIAMFDKLLGAYSQPPQNDENVLNTSVITKVIQANAKGPVIIDNHEQEIIDLEMAARNELLKRISMGKHYKSIY